MPGRRVPASHPAGQLSSDTCRTEIGCGLRCYYEADQGTPLQQTNERPYVGSISYSIEVEQGGQLLINQKAVPPPAEVTAGEEDILAWALSQVRLTYANYYGDDSTIELTLKVHDRRPGGLLRRSKFVNPGDGIDLESLISDRAAEESPPAEEGLTSPPEQQTPPPPPRPAPSAQPQETSPASPPSQEGPTPDNQAAKEEEVSNEPPDESPLPEQHPPAAERMEPAPDSAPVMEEPQPAPAPAPVSQQQVQPQQTPSAPAPEDSLSHEERMARQRGWKRLDPDKVTRPKIGAAESKGRPSAAGIMKEARKQKWVQAVGIAAVIILVIVGFRVFNGGTTYEAFCVDQRTMTRAVTGVACQDSEDTNHRWWYTADKDGTPEVGETINEEAGSFDEPSGDKDEINKNVENPD